MIPIKIYEHKSQRITNSELEIITKESVENKLKELKLHYNCNIIDIYTKDNPVKIHIKPMYTLIGGFKKEEIKEIEKEYKNKCEFRIH